MAADDGRIYAIGYQGSGLGAKKAVVLGFTAAGEPATDFGDNGVATMQVPPGVPENAELGPLRIELRLAGKLTVLMDAFTSYFHKDGVDSTNGGFAVLRLNR